MFPELSIEFFKVDGAMYPEGWPWRVEDGLELYNQYDPAKGAAELFGRKEFDDPLIRRAILGYLLSCPLPTAKQQLEQLAKRFPQQFADAKKAIETLPPGL